MASGSSRSGLAIGFDMNFPEQTTHPRQWTLAAFRQGALDMLPFVPGLTGFAMAYGTVAARKGMTLFETLLMSGTVFAGVVQMVVLDSWPQTLTVGAIAGIVALAALVLRALRRRAGRGAHRLSVRRLLVSHRRRRGRQHRRGIQR